MLNTHDFNTHKLRITIKRAATRDLPVLTLILKPKFWRFLLTNHGSFRTKKSIQKKTRFPYSELNPVLTRDKYQGFEPQEWIPSGTVSFGDLIPFLRFFHTDQTFCPQEAAAKRAGELVLEQTPGLVLKTRVSSATLRTRRFWVIHYTLVKNCENTMLASKSIDA